MGSRELYDTLSRFSERIRLAVENEKSIAIITSLNSDGLCSGGIATISLLRLGGKCSVRTVVDLTADILSDLKSSGYDLFILIDLGINMVSKLSDSLGVKWLLINHQIMGYQIEEKSYDQVINLDRCGIDGNIEISSGGLAYLLAMELNNKNKDLSTLAVVSALAEKQDIGEKRSFVGINSEIVNSAQSIGALSVKSGLMITGETSPIHEAIARNLAPCIDGLTWNYENSYSLVKNSGLRMKNKNGHWRILGELDHEERGILTENIVKFIVTSTTSGLSVADDLTGYIYTLREDPETSIRDARQFVELLNACASANKGGVGLGICMGDRRISLDEGEMIFLSYKSALKENLSRIFSERWRLNDYGNCVIVSGEGAVHETMIDSVCSFLMECLTFNGKLLLVRTITKDNTHYKFSVMKGFKCKFPSIIGDLVKNCSEAVGGVAWGRPNSAICEIPIMRLEEFMTSIRKRIGDTKFGE
jgi:single-stranded-DNA-specific exonuclease